MATVALQLSMIWVDAVLHHANNNERIARVVGGERTERLKQSLVIIEQLASSTRKEKWKDE
jgi:hypothetical protein